MCKKNKKIISLVMTVLMILLSFSITYANGFPSGLTPASEKVGNDIKNMGNKATGYVLWAANAVAMGMLIYVGIRYAMAPANERADIKGGTIKYLIGAIIIFGATGVFAIIKSIADSVVVAV